MSQLLRLFEIVLEELIAKYVTCWNFKAQVLTSVESSAGTLHRCNVICLCTALIRGCLIVPQHPYTPVTSSVTVYHSMSLSFAFIPLTQRAALLSTAFSGIILLFDIFHDIPLSVFIRLFPLLDRLVLNS